jgi:hypothetical protein
VGRGPRVAWRGRGDRGISRTCGKTDFAADTFLGPAGTPMSWFLPASLPRATIKSRPPFLGDKGGRSGYRFGADWLGLDRRGTATGKARRHRTPCLMIANPALDLLTRTYYSLVKVC